MLSDFLQCLKDEAKETIRHEEEYFFPFLKNGSKHYVKNIQTEIKLLQAGGHVFPLTINDTEYDNAHTCSLFTRYVTYAKQEIDFLKSKVLRKALHLPLTCLGGLLKFGKSNRVVSVNNWLVSTNLYPSMKKIGIEELTAQVAGDFSDHAILFPSLNEHTNAALISELQKAGYLLIPSREVFIFDKQLKDYMKRRVTRSDFDLLKKAPYEIINHSDITENDYERMLELYDALYIKKYSSCNPRFSVDFIRLCHEKKLWNFQGLRGSDGVLGGVIATYQRDGTMITPFMGYDPDVALKEGLYRALTALSLKESSENEWIFNMGAGCSEFKKWRGGVGFVEYSAVYCKHLPLRRQKVWRLLEILMRRIGIPLMKKHEF